MDQIIYSKDLSFVFICPVFVSIFFLKRFKSFPACLLANNALLANRQAGNDLNLLRKKIDTNTGQINTKLKSLEYII